MKNKNKYLLYNDKFLTEKSEIIVKEILDKIIINSIYISENEKLNLKIYNTCFDFTKNMINNAISFKYISYDKDETRNEDKTTIINNTESQIFPGNNMSQISPSENVFCLPINSHRSNKYLEEKKLFSNYPHGINNWNICTEPKSSKYDRYSSTLINLKNFKNKNKHKINHKIEENKTVKEENEEENKKSRKNLKRSLKYFKSSKLISSFSSFKSLLSSIKKPKIHKSIRDIMNEFSFYYIKDESEENCKKNSEKDFEKLRKEFEEQKEINKKEMIEMKAKKYFTLKKLKLEQEENMKYKGKNITKDHNGQIIFIKKMKLNKLINEFFIPKTNHKFIKEEKNPEIKNEDIIEKPLEKESLYLQKSKNSYSKELKMHNLAKNNLPLINKSKTAINIFYNEGNKEMDYFADINYKKKENNIKPFPPSGSNFNIINLEVGVSMKEENKFKTGGKDFFSKFKKYSNLNFEEKWKEELEQNTLKIKSKNEMQNTNDINDKILKNLPSSDNNSKKSLLSKEISNIFIDNSSQKNNISTNTLNINWPLKNNLYFDNKELSYNKSISNINSSIYTNNKPKIHLFSGSTSLSDLFSINDKTINIKEKGHLPKNKNIFRKTRNIKSLKNAFSLQDINDFNKAILTNKNIDLYIKKYAPSSTEIKPKKKLLNKIHKEIEFNKTISRNKNYLMLLKKPKTMTIFFK